METMEPVVVALVVGLLLAYHVLPALLIHATQRFPEDIRAVPFQPDATALPRHIADYFANAESALTRLGFRCLGGIALPDPLPNVKAIVTLYVHPMHRDSAMITFIYGVQANVLPPLQLRYVEFISRFDDETVRLVQTNNTDNSGSFPAKPSDLTFRFSHINDIEHLYRLHQKLVAQHGPSSRKVVRALDEFHGDLVRYLNAILVEAYREQEQSGYVAYDAINRQWRPTFRGAGLMAWRELPPWKQFSTMRLRQLGKNLERELEG
jgi:hypothetical protein